MMLPLPLISSVSVSPVKVQKPRQYGRSQVTILRSSHCFLDGQQLKIDLGLAKLYLVSDHFPVTLPLQSVYSREVDEEELEAETALRERDERIRELEMVIMKQVDIAILTTSMSCFRFCSNDSISCFALDIHYCQAQDMAQMKQHFEILSKEQDGPATD